MMLPPPPPIQKDPYREDHDLHEAQKKLSEIRGRPFDVDTVLAQNRAKQEREFEVRKRAEEKLDEARKQARERRHEIHAAEIQKQKSDMLEKKIEFEERNLQSEKRVLARQSKAQVPQKEKER